MLQEKTPVQRYCVLLITLALLCSGSLAWATANGFDKPVLHPAIPLVDETGQHVLSSGKPYSTRMSCGGGSGGCHDIDKIASAYHFEMGHNETDDRYGAKRGVVPVVSPGYFGGFNCMLANNPLWLSKKNNASVGEFLDYGAPGLLESCGGCHNGGGFGEKDRNGNRYDQVAASAIVNLDGDYYDWQGGQTPLAWDWKKSGVVEPDCLLCHADLTQMKNNPAQTGDGQVVCQGMDCKVNVTSQWNDLRTNQLLKKGYFAYAGSAIFKYLNVDNATGQDRFLLTDLSGLDTAAGPKLKWNKDAFDENGKMQMPMLRFPDNQNCMLCHVTSHQRRGFYGFDERSLVENAKEGTPLDDFHDDVHKGKTWTEQGESRDIENCNACHSKQYYKAAYRNVDIDADHNFLMGNSDQDVRRDLNLQPGPLSCEHCHGGERFGSSEPPALPSGHANILAAHRELWKARGDMVGYPSNTLDKVTQVHLDVVACQTCHIPSVSNEGTAISIRYRYHQTEDGRLKMTPYQATPRFYWWDKNNQRIISRRERLQVNGSELAPQGYEATKQLKAAFDDLLTQKGYRNVDTQLVWTESNDYLITHNTKPSVLAMPCDDCHERKSNGSVSSLVTPKGVLGENNQRVVATMADKTAYPRLVAEGVVKLDMPYFKLDSDGRIVENVSDILYETKINPFTTALRATSQNVVEGEFKLTSVNEALSNSALAKDVAAVAAANGLSTQNLFLFNTPIAGKELRGMALLVGYNNASKVIVPNYRLEVATRPWLSLSQHNGKKKVLPLKTYAISQDKLKGVVTSSVFDFSLQDKQKQPSQALGGNRLLVKLPYAGRATSAAGVRFLALQTDKQGVLELKPFSPVAADIVSVVPGNTSDYGYVLAFINELPTQGVLVDLTVKPKNKSR